MLCSLSHHISIDQWLTLGAHVPQGYSICVCVCVSGSIFPNSNKSAKKTYGLPQRCNRFIYSVVFFVKQPLREATNLSGSRIGVPVGHFACPCRRPNVYPIMWCVFCLVLVLLWSNEARRRNKQKYEGKISRLRKPYCFNLTCSTCAVVTMALYIWD